jgi:hypothetical protein
LFLHYYTSIDFVYSLFNIHIIVYREI